MRLIILVSLLISGCSSAAIEKSRESCFGRPDLQAVKSARLQQLEAEDQADRSHTPIDWSVVTPRDIRRRIEVGEIFALGCFAAAADYAAAAMVYQHGDTPDHAYQAFIWSKRAVELGDSKQKWLVSAAIDRYLVRIGQMQLFATQFSRAFDENCLCLDPVEPTFPDKLRLEYASKTLEQALLFVVEQNKNDPTCKDVGACKRDRKRSPKGTVPGLW